MKTDNFILFLFNMYLCACIFSYLHYKFPNIIYMDKLMLIYIIFISIIHWYTHMKIKETMYEKIISSI